MEYTKGQRVRVKDDAFCPQPIQAECAGLAGTIQKPTADGGGFIVRLDAPPKGCRGVCFFTDSELQPEEDTHA